MAELTGAKIMNEDRPQPDDAGGRAHVLAVALDDLQIITKEVESRSLISGYITALNGFLFFMTAVSLRLHFGYPASDVFYLSILIISPLALISAILFLNKFERLVAVGNTYYQEVSDSLEWEKADSKLRFQTRLVLKRFVISASLPFYRIGGNGPFVYLAINVMSAIATVILVVSFAR